MERKPNFDVDYLNKAATTVQEAVACLGMVTGSDPAINSVTATLKAMATTCFQLAEQRRIASQVHPD